MSPIGHHAGRSHCDQAYPAPFNPGPIVSAEPPFITLVATAKVSMRHETG
jgi:hypothetical protein